MISDDNGTEIPNYSSTIKTWQELEDVPKDFSGIVYTGEGEPRLAAPNEHIANLWRLEFPGYKVVVSDRKIPDTGGNPPHKKGRPPNLS